MPSRSLGTLTVDLLARTGGFTQGMTAAERQSAAATRKIQRQHKEMADALDRIYTRIKLAGAAAFAGLAVSVKSSLDHMVELGVQAARLQLPAGQFSQLVAVAKDADVEVDNLARGMTRLQQAFTSKNGKDALRSLGIDPAKIKDAHDGLLKVADAFKAHADGAEKAAIATTIFGRNGVKLIPLLNQGSDAIREQEAQALALGTAYGDTASNELAEYDRMMKQVTATTTGLRNKIALAVLPVFNDFAKAIGDSTINVDDLRRASDDLSKEMGVHTWLQKAALGAAAFFDVLRAIVKGVRLVATSVEAAWADITVTTKQLANAVPFVGQVFISDEELAKAEADRKKLYGVGQKQLDDLLNFHLTYDALQKRFNNPTKPAPFSAPTTKPTIPSLGDDTPEKGGRGRSATKKLTDEQREQAALMRELDSLYDRHRAAILGVDSAQLKLTDTVNDAVTLLANGRITWEQYGDVISGAVASQFDKSTKKVKEATDDISQFSIQAARNIQDTLGDSVYQMLTGNFKGIAESWSNMILRMVSQAYAAQLGQALFGGLGGGGGGGFFGKLLGSAVQGIAGMFGGGMFANASTFSMGGSLSAMTNAVLAGARADGGPVISGKTYLVGERGPELFTPGASGAITPNGAGGNVVVNVINQGGQNLQVEQTQQRRGPNGEQIVQVLVRQAMQKMASSGEMDAIMRPYGRRQATGF